MISKKIQNVVIGAVLVGASMAVAAPAIADNIGTLPSGCTLSPTKPSVVSTKVAFSGTGTCSTAYAMATRLVHDYDSLPDVRVKEVEQYGGPNFYGSGATCDGGGSTKYYTELAFYFNFSGNVQRISSKVTLSHC